MTGAIHKSRGEMVELNLPIPPSVNHYWRHTRGNTFIDKRGVAFRQTVRLAFIHPVRQMRIDGRLSVTIVLFPRNKGRIDLDNCLKSCLDALQHAGVYEDDSQIDELIIRRGGVIPGGGGINVKVTQYRQTSARMLKE